MNDVRSNTVHRVLRGSIVMMASQVITILSYFLAQRLILSTLTKETNGVFFAERRLVDLLVIILVDAGLNMTAVRRASQNPEQTGIVVSSTMALRLLLVIPVSGIAMVYGTAAGFNVLDLFLWCCFCIVSSRMGILRYLMELPYRNDLRFGVPALSAIMDAVFFLGMLSLNTHNLTPTVIIWCFFVGALPGFIVLSFLDKGRIANWKHVRWSEMKILAVEALPVAAMIGLLAVHDKIDVMMLDWWSTAEQVGIFGAAYVTLAPITTTIPVAISLAIMPVLSRLAKADRDECSRYVSTLLRGLALVAVVTSSVVSILTIDVINLVSKGKYLDNQVQFSMFLWMPLPIYILTFIQDAIVAVGLNRRAFVIGVTLASSTVIACTILIPMFAAIGAIVAKFISITAGMIVALWLLRPYLQSSFTTRFLTSLLFLVCVGFSGFELLPMVMHRYMAAPLNGMIVLGAAFAIGLITTSDVRRIYSTLRSRSSEASV